MRLSAVLQEQQGVFQMIMDQIGDMSHILDDVHSLEYVYCTQPFHVASITLRHPATPRHTYSYTLLHTRTHLVPGAFARSRFARHISVYAIRLLSLALLCSPATYIVSSLSESLHSYAAGVTRLRSQCDPVRQL